jgi:hypothetical protein
MGRLPEAYRQERAARIASDATKAPIVLARILVGRHIADLRRRGLVTVKPSDPGLIMALLELSHDIASAVLDARLHDGHIRDETGN